MTTVPHYHYRYQPLEGGSAFRLVYLSPGQWEEPLRCEILHDILDNPSPYEALSYMWGDLTATTTIVINQHRITITKSLEAALRHLRKADEIRTLWVDALCIDQENVEERNVQVPQMWRIFSKAHGVISWLGESDEDSEAAFDTAEALEAARIEGSLQRQSTVAKASQGAENLPQIFDSFDKRASLDADQVADIAIDQGREEVRDADTQNDDPNRLIIALDYGSTYTGIDPAYDFPAIDLSTSWTLQDNFSKVPSVISYTRTSDENQWGADLDQHAVEHIHTKLQLEVQEEQKAEHELIIQTQDAIRDLDSLEHYNWRSILNLLNRAYFGRVWVVQELFYAGGVFDTVKDRCVFQCGDRTMPRSLLLRAWRLLESIEVTSESYEQHGDAWMFGRSEGLKEPLKTLVNHGTLHGQPDSPEIFNVLRDACAMGEDKLARLITSTMSFKATDPRDKVYALLRMAQISNDDFPVDYSRDANQVLQDITVYAIKTSGTLGILQGNRRSTNSVTPSWIPDPTVLPVRGVEWTHHNRFASRSRIAYCEYVEESGLLKLDGIWISRIKKKIGPFTFGRTFKQDDLLPLRNYYRSLDRSHRESLWRTLIMDLDRTNAFRRARNHPASMEFGAMCDSFLGEAGAQENIDVENVGEWSASLFLTNMYDSAQRRCVIELENGMLGLGPYDAVSGDVIAILFGGGVCFTLRSRNEHYQLVGDCYIHGAMQGQLVDQADTEPLREQQTFILC